MGRSSAPGRPVAIFRLDADPLERDNRVGSEAQALARFEQELTEALRAAAARSRSVKSISLSSDEEARLRSLGYL